MLFVLTFAAHVLADGMIDRIVEKEETADAAVGRRFVRIDLRASFDVLEDCALESRRVGRHNVLGNDAPARSTLPESDHGSFADSAAPGAQLL